MLILVTFGANGDNKRRRVDSLGEISPTIPYTVDPKYKEDANQLVMAAQPKTGMDPCHLGVPGENQLMMWLCETVIKKHFDDVSHNAVPMVISSASYRWVQIAWVHHYQTIDQCFKQILPHAIEDHFAWVQIEGKVCQDGSNDTRDDQGMCDFHAEEIPCPDPDWHRTQF